MPCTRNDSATSHAAALASVGVQSACMTWLQPDGSRRAYLPDLPMSRVLASIEFWAAGSRDRGTGSLVIRPSPPDDAKRHLIQLDDITESTLAKVEPLSLFVLETSPRSWQAWLCLCGIEDPRLLERAVKKATGADRGASRACRVAGSLNVKEKYAPDYPVVQLLSCSPGRLVTAEELVSGGLLPADWHAEAARLPPPPRHPSFSPWRWPDYQRALAGAPRARTHSGHDRSAADAFWCFLALRAGWSPDETAAELMRVSPKARSRELTYALDRVNAAQDRLEMKKDDGRGDAASPSAIGRFMGS